MFVCAAKDVRKISAFEIFLLICYNEMRRTERDFARERRVRFEQ
jgi:hypothetical protein